MECFRCTKLAEERERDALRIWAAGDVARFGGMMANFTEEEEEVVVVSGGCKAAYDVCVISVIIWTLALLSGNDEILLSLPNTNVRMIQCDT